MSGGDARATGALRLVEAARKAHRPAMTNRGGAQSRAVAGLVFALVGVGPAMAQEFEPPHSVVDQSALLGRAMACLKRNFPPVRDQFYIPVFRVYADASGRLTRPPVLTNPGEGTEAISFARSAGTALVRCQPLPMDVRPGNEGRREYSRLIRFDPRIIASPDADSTSARQRTTDEDGRIRRQAGQGVTGKTDLRGLTLGMSKADALAVVTSKLNAKCLDPDDGDTLYTCHASAPAATFSLAFTVVTPSVLARVTYRFMTTHDRSVVIGDVTRSFGPPLAEANRLDWATWALGRSTRLHLQRGGDDWYDLILDDDEIATRAYEAVQRARNAAPPPRF